MDQVADDPGVHSAPGLALGRVLDFDVFTGKELDAFEFYSDRLDELGIDTATLPTLDLAQFEGADYRHVANAQRLIETGIQRTEVRKLDPELYADEASRYLVTQGLEISGFVTDVYGTPHAPTWATGRYQTTVFMAYHSGEPDGHTSTGPLGVGVPRNVLVIADRVNGVAGSTVYPPRERAAGFVAACAHDLWQQCGRTLMPEGQTPGRGDERLSAVSAAMLSRWLGADEELASSVHEGIMATAWDPTRQRQRIQYADGWRGDAALTQLTLMQELVAAADQFHAVTKRGPLSSIEHTAECMCWIANDQIIQARLEARGESVDDYATTEQVLTLIGDDAILREKFDAIMDSQPRFYGEILTFSDEAIARICGAGIDELFPGRDTTVATLEQYGRELRSGSLPVDIWREARSLAGYPEPSPADRTTGHYSTGPERWRATVLRTAEDRAAFHRVAASDALLSVRTGMSSSFEVVADSVGGHVRSVLAHLDRGRLGTLVRKIDQQGSTMHARLSAARDDATAAVGSAVHDLREFLGDHSPG